MPAKIFQHLLSLAALLILVPGAPAQEEQGASLREIQVKEILTSCKGKPVPEIWKRADALAALGAPAKRAIRRSLPESSLEGRLAGLKALIELDSPTYAAEKLMGIAGNEKLAETYRIAAIELVGLTEEEDAEEGLLELAAAFSPRIRIAAARALWRLGGPRSYKAKTVLREFLKASDPKLRAQGALALAEMGDGLTPGVKATLLELRKEPGLRGQLAAALYEKLNLEQVIQIRERESEAGAARTSSGLWRPLDEIRRLLDRAYELDGDISPNALRARAARGVLDIPGDPHTQFMTPEEYSEFLHGSHGVDPSYGGIGAFIDTNVKDRFQILRPIFGGPAWDADIRGGDDIVAVNGKPTAGRATTDIIKDVKGPAGTPVILTIFREGWSEPREIKVIRARIVLPTVFARMLPGKIGYVVIAQFAYETGKELRAKLEELERRGLRALILDLRDNPGGLLTSVKECLSLFLRGHELICTLKGRAYGQEKHYATLLDGKNRTYPIAVLVNGRSASGAELTSGVLQYYSTISRRAASDAGYLDTLLFGERTFGKGTVQHTIPLRSWKGEDFTDEPRRNGRWDGPSEPFTDANGNGRWDPGEAFTDRPRRNGRWDDAEPWKDTNGNGRRDPGESFTDENHDGAWNAAEPFTDANHNGRYDYGAAVKMTVARYYLPGGTNFTRTQVFSGGKYLYKGGVEPDVEIANPRMDVDHLVKLREMQEKGIFSDYVRSRWKEHHDLFKKLAYFDGRDPSRYPDFEAFFASLHSRLARQEVRRALRIEVRREVANEIGKEIYGDLSDDAVLRAGVRHVLKRLGIAPESIPEYASLDGAPKGTKTK